MKRISSALACLFFICSAPTAAVAADVYDPVPAHGAVQYFGCVHNANETFTGGKAKSPIAGQSKAEAYCTCMWSESPQDFDGDLVKWGEKTKEGSKYKSICEKYSNWS